MAKQKDKIDVLIVGAGIAGLSLALYLIEQAPNLRIVILAKSSMERCNTAMAKGGIAAVSDFKHDSFQQHIADTFKAGNGQGNIAAITELVEAAPESIRDLISWGVHFDQKGKEFDLHQEAGHQVKRILHTADYTGKEIHQKLLAAVDKIAQIELWENTMAVDFITKANNCQALKIINSEQKLETLQAAVYVLASGGSGQLFGCTTNSSIATGDGVAMAVRAGVNTSGLAYYQFHPTAIYIAGAEQLDLLTEALRGFGAHIVNHAGERFLFQYDAAGEMANRAIVSKAIFAELNKSGEQHVFLRLHQLNHQELQEKFPSAMECCRSNGFNPFVEDIPIIPAAHYQCGGITVDLFAQTNLPNLFSIGECADTKVHGTNRLASNSLLEANVFAKKASLAIVQQLKNNPQTLAEINPQDFEQKEKTERKEVGQQEVVEIRKYLQTKMRLVYLEEIDSAAFMVLKNEFLQLKIKLKQQAIRYTVAGGELLNLIELGVLYLEAQMELKPLLEAEV